MKLEPHNGLALPCFVDEAQKREERQSLIKEVTAFIARNNIYGLDLESPWLSKVLAAYEQPHRHFHTLAHLGDICRLIEENVVDSAELRGKLMLTALFHDVVWVPQGDDSEDQSVAAFDFIIGHYNLPIPAAVRQEVSLAILSTKAQSSENELGNRFHEFDCHVILRGSPIDLLAYEFQIFREFQYLNMLDYRKGRREFFSRFSRRFPQCRDNMNFLIDYLERRRPRVGIYGGTFNPFHIGHLSILEKAEQMFDKVIVAVGINPAKQIKRDPHIEKDLPFHEVVYFDTLMVDFVAMESTFADVTLVRGLRNGYDLDYEMNQLCFMQQMMPGIRTVYLPCDKHLEHVSSSALNSLATFNVQGRDSIYYPKKFHYYNYSIEELFA
ncbi:MAG: adenylyltransferase/cytidyltransferase family protein [Oligosphaeraceae bacterium]|nr:adenylyltransferase/cytidyltransferase family protein [Oligosphaeraceae bacterium]